MENLTEILRQVLVMLGARHKERLGTGLAVGMVILFLQASLAEAGLLPTVPVLIGVAGSIAAGVLIMFAPLWLDPKQRLIGEDEQKVLALMDELSHRGGLTARQKKNAYIQVLKKLIDSYRPGEPSELVRSAEAAIQEAASDNREVGRFAGVADKPALRGRPDA